MPNKVFRTYQEQLSILKSRGMIITDDKIAIETLKKVNYYNLINGYKDLFIANTKPTERYKSGTKFFEIVALYDFDRYLRELFLRELLRVEKKIASKITYIFSQKYGYDHNTYLTLNSFNTKDKKNTFLAQEQISKLIIAIERYKKRHNTLMHYLGEYHYIPLWVLATVLSFGDLNRLYSRLKDNEKVIIARDFGLSPEEFESIGYILCAIRNKCAHGNRVYSYKSDCLQQAKQSHRKPHPIKTLKYHKLLNIPVKNNVFKFGKEDILAFLISIKFFMDPDRYIVLINNIHDAIQTLSQCLSTISINDVTGKMGLYSNWLQLRNL